MADVKELNINNTTYNIKDAVARSGLTNKQDTLVSGTNIKTINGNSILGSGDLTVTAEATRNIGEIVASTIPLTDAGLHLLDGSLIQGSGIYSAFVTYIAGLVSTYPNIFVTESAWQTSVTTYGVCGKFVYDSTNNTVRLPKVTGIIEGTTDVTALGDLVQAGLPNIYAKLGGYFNGANYVVPSNTQGIRFVNEVGCCSNNISDNKPFNTVVDASLSSSIYGNSSTVQPQTVKVLYYIVIATSSKTEIQVDIDEIATDLNGKTDVDLTNVNNSGTSRSAMWAMPSATSINLTLGATGTTYTAPANGYFCLSAGGTGSNNWIEMTCGAMENGIYGTIGWNLKLFVPAQKEQVLTIAYQNIDVSTANFRFIYAQGSESEAS